MCSSRKYPYLPMEGIFSNISPPLWKFQLSYISFFKLFGLSESPTPQEIPIPSVGGVWIFSGTYCTMSFFYFFSTVSKKYHILWFSVNLGLNKVYSLFQVTIYTIKFSFNPPPPKKKETTGTGMRSSRKYPYSPLPTEGIGISWGGGGFLEDQKI